MRTFILKRVISGIVLIIAVPTITFFLTYSSPENIARKILGENAFPDQIQATIQSLGLDRPVIVQYFDWLGGVFRGDLGTSWFNSTSVADAIFSRLPVTLSLVIVGVAVIAVFAVVLGVTAAIKGGWVDKVLQVLSVAGFALPNFWLGLILVLVFAVGLRLLPATGYVPLDVDPSLWAASLVLPVTALALHGVANATQQIRGAVIDVMEQDFVRTLRSRGLSARSLILKHALKNAAPAGLTVLSLQFISLLSGAVVIEKVFALPGIGSYTVNATALGDVPSIVGVMLVTTVMIVIVNIVIDLAYGWVNPKVRVK